MRNAMPQAPIETEADETGPSGARRATAYLRNNVLPKAITLVAVTVPLSATGFAAVELWERQVFPIDLALLGSFYLLTGLGITVGFHRLATHRSFKTSRVVEFILLALGSMAVEGQVLQWVATHARHHRLADKPGDPHSPLEGLLHAHVGWMFSGANVGTRELDAKHLARDPVARFVDRTFIVWLALGFVIPFLIDGWRGLIWGGLVRVFLTHHVTWSVNSVCHQFGRRTFATPDESRNQWVVGLVGLGEGWHNNHHAFPESAYHGLRWYQVDLSAYVIRGLARIGLAREVRRPSAEQIRRRKTRYSLSSLARARARGRAASSDERGRLGRDLPERPGPEAVSAPV
jgi:stearoyl-CoA desaturase (delta-9 desaturase)